MIRDGDHILIGVSGGKDSLSMSIALRERLSWVPISYELTDAEAALLSKRRIVETKLIHTNGIEEDTFRDQI